MSIDDDMIYIYIYIYIYIPRYCHREQKKLNGIFPWGYAKTGTLLTTSSKLSNNKTILYSLSPRQHILKEQQSVEFFEEEEGWKIKKRYHILSTAEPTPLPLPTHTLIN